VTRVDECIARVLERGEQFQGFLKVEPHVAWGLAAIRCIQMITPLTCVGRWASLSITV